MIAFILIVSTGAYLAFVSFIIVGLFKHSYQPINPFKESPFISIIIAARNEEAYLPNLIQDLVKQEYPTDKLEVMTDNITFKPLLQNINIIHSSDVLS